jgi:RHS repeat-associated protein
MQTDGREVLKESCERRQNEIELRRSAGDVSHSVVWKLEDDERVHSVSVDTIRTIQYAYDEQGRCIEKRLPSGRNVFYSWDAEGRLLRVWSSDKSVDYRYSYDHGQLRKVFDAISKKTLIREYDEVGRIVVDGEEGCLCRAEYAADGLLQRLDLPDGIVISYTTKDITRTGSKNWTIQAPEELCRAPMRPLPLCCRPKSSEKKDPLGAWKQKYSYDTLNQLTKESGEFNNSYRFNACGELVHGIPSVYDAEGLPVRIGEGNTCRQLQYDALGRLTSVQVGKTKVVYRYDGLSRLREIQVTEFSHTKRQLCLWYDSVDLGTLFQGKLQELRVLSSSLQQVVALETHGMVYTVDTDDHGSVIALKDVAGKIAEVYRYSAFGDIHVYGPSSERRSKARSSWLFAGKRWLAHAQCYDYGMRRYCPALRAWLEHDPAGHIDGPDDRIFVRNNPVLFIDKDGLFPWPIDWSSIRQSVNKALPFIAENVRKSITFSKTLMDWVGEFRSSFEEMVFNVLGRGQLKLVGYNPDHSSVGKINGSTQLAKARITAINGILNGSEEIISSAELISSTHGNVPVHYVYAATEGFTGDILRAGFSKAGFLTRPARLLVELWRSLLQEMGGVESGATIVHYAHSLGATDTMNALLDLSEKERQCIIVRTLGSPTLIPSGLCFRVDHYISLKDGIPMFDTYRYYQGMKGNDPSIHFLPTDTSVFFADHVLDCKTYRTLLESLGQKFQEEYCQRLTQ